MRNTLYFPCRRRLSQEFLPRVGCWYIEFVIVLPMNNHTDFVYQNLNVFLQKWVSWYFTAELRIRIRIRSDPVFFATRIRIQDNTGSGSGSFIHKKTSCYSNFLVIKLSKIQFRPNNFLSLILSGIIIFYLWF